MQVCILTMTLAYLFYISTQYDCKFVTWNVRKVRQASKSTTGTFHRSLEITKWPRNTLPPRNKRL